MTAQRGGTAGTAPLQAARPDQDDVLGAVFDDDYLLLHDPLVDAPRSDKEVAVALQVLEPPPGGRLLDLCCGHGRLANRLAAQGFQLDGLDGSAVFLERAAADAAAAGVKVDYRRGDAAALPYADASFDGILCWFTSFGLGDDAKNRSILAEACRVLKPGRRLAIDLVNPYYIVMGFQRHAVQENAGRTMVDVQEFDVATGRFWIDRRFIGGGRPERRLRFFIRQFTLPEIRDWLLQAGFAWVEAVDGDGGPFLPSSAAMVVVAGKA